jgi:Brp/Blh family beta-carotene 15,15'-monooxygenase
VIALPSGLPLWAILPGVAALFALLPAPGILAQLGLTLPCVIIFGLPHGAADWWLAAGVLPRHLPATLPWPVVFGLFYLGVSALTAAAIVAAPTVMLALFIAVSAWHFGETDARALGLGVPALRSVPLGLLPIAAPLALRATEAAQILDALGVPADPARLRMVFLPLLALAMAASLWLAAVAGRRHGLALVREQAGLLLLAACAPPLLFFLVYFCGVHAPRQAAALRATGKAGVVWLAATGAAALIAVPLVLFAHGAAPPVLALRGLFWGLAVLTFPHVLFNGLLGPATTLQREATAS